MKREDFVFSVSFCLAYNLPQPPPPPSPPPPKKNQGWENGGFWLSRGFILDLWGGGRDGCLLFYFIMSKIVGLPRTLSRESQLLTDMSYIRLHCAFSVRMYNDLNQGGA